MNKVWAVGRDDGCSFIVHSVFSTQHLAKKFIDDYENLNGFPWAYGNWIEESGLYIEEFELNLEPKLEFPSRLGLKSKRR